MTSNTRRRRFANTVTKFVIRSFRSPRALARSIARITTNTYHETKMGVVTARRELEEK